jgi:hypothetical protein
MKVTTKNWFKLGFDGDDYWMNRALEGLEGLPEDTSADSLLFATRELAVIAAVEVLRRYVDTTPLTPPASNSFGSTADREAAMAQTLGVVRTYESRHKGEAVITDKGPAVTLTRQVEVRLKGVRLTKRSVTVDGEVYEKVDEELVTSDWFPGHDVTLRLNVWMATHHVAE